MYTPNIQIEYDWCQYTADEGSGLFTVRRIEKRDIAKTFSKAEALQMIEKFKIIDEQKRRKGRS